MNQAGEDTQRQARFGHDAAAGRADEPPVTGGFLATYQLIRPVEGRRMAGVCGAIGRATGTDPLLWQVILAVLVVFAGAGLVLYMLGWLLFPAEGDETSRLESLFGGKKSSGSPLLTFLLVLGSSLLFIYTMISTSGRPFLIFGALAVAIAVLARRRGDEPAATTPQPAQAASGGYRAPFAPGGPYAPGRTRQLPAAVDSGTMQLPGATTAADAEPPGDTLSVDAPVTAVPDSGYPSPPPPTSPPPPPPPPPPAARSRRPQSRLGLITGCLIVIAMSVLSIVSMSGVPVTFSLYVAVALILCGLGLIVGTWWGRSPMLYVTGLLLSALMGLTMLIDGAGITGYGDRAIAVSTVDELPEVVTVQLGNTDLDLQMLELSDDETAEFTADVWMGNLDIRVGPDVDVIVKAYSNGTGDISLEHAGTNGPGRETLVSEGGPGGGELTITANVELGNLEVNR